MTLAFSSSNQLVTMASRVSETGICVAVTALTIRPSGVISNGRGVVGAARAKALGRALGFPKANLPNSESFLYWQEVKLA